jgi:fumarate hydratase subunit beta
MIKSDKQIIKLYTPLKEKEISRLKIEDPIEINGIIYCGRDAVLPKIKTHLENGSLDSLNIDFKGSVIFHTAVSPAGIGPTTSNKFEIEDSMPALSKAGVRIHLGKGSISPKTIACLKRHNAVFAITPPVSALFSDKIISQKIVAFPKEGMEALYEIEVLNFPAIVACANGKTIFS